MSQIKKSKLDELNNEILPYLYRGYDLFFIHGWFTAYLSAPSDSEDDLLIPTYLILDEAKIKNEDKFAKTIDKIVEMYSDLADSIYEKNKPLKPLIDFAKPNSFDPVLLSQDEKQNLLLWLYGYLTCYLVTTIEVTEQIEDGELLEEKFYPALFTLSIAFISLISQVNLDFMAHDVRNDFEDLVNDIKAMWESDDGEAATDEIFNESIAQLDLTDILVALNDIFYVIRINDEKRFSSQEGQKTLLEKLTKN